MLRLFRYSLILVTSIVFLLASIPTQAQEVNNRGLLISPPRYTMDVDAGKSVRQTITVANYTPQPLDITLSIDEFKVANLSYEYQIKSTSNAWIYIEQTEIHLEPNQTRNLIITANPPATSPPGGNYYLIVASATTKNGALTNTIQVAAPIYITVNGELDKSSKLEETHSIDRVVFGDSIPFQIDVSNTGNVHYQIDVKGRIDMAIAADTTVSTQHILLPDTTRRLNSSIPSPTFPGLYKVVYGYSSESSGDILLSARVLYIPPWSIAILILLVWVSFVIIRKRRQQ